MNFNFNYIIEEILVVLALSIDAFVCCFSYGINKVSILRLSKLIITVICTAFLSLAIFAGTALSELLNEETGKIISFIILMVLGIIKLFDSFIKSLIKKKTINKNIRFSLFSLKFTLNIYASPLEADSDKSLSLSPLEAVSLALALSLDGIGVGIGVGIIGYNIISVAVLSVVFTLAAIYSGEFLGSKLSKVAKHDWSFVGGIVIVALAITKILF